MGKFHLAVNLPPKTDTCEGFEDHVVPKHWHVMCPGYSSLDVNMWMDTEIIVLHMAPKLCWEPSLNSATAYPTLLGTHQ